MIRESAAVDPVSPEATGFRATRVHLGARGRHRAVTPTQDHEGRLTLSQTVSGANGATFDAKAHVTGQRQSVEVGIVGRYLIVGISRVLPIRVGPAVIEGRLTVQQHVDRAVKTRRRAHQNTPSVEIPGRTTMEVGAVARAVPGTNGHVVVDDQPTAAGLPRGGEDHRSWNVLAVGRHRAIDRS